MLKRAQMSVLVAIVALSATFFCGVAFAEEKRPETLHSIQEFLRDNKLRPVPGPLDMYVDDQKSTIHLELPDLNQDFIYAVTLATGIGTTNLSSSRGAMDRGVSSRERLVTFRRY